MTIRDMVTEKKAWREQQKRVKKLPKEYQIVYKEIQNYLFKVTPTVIFGEGNLLDELLQLFEDGVSDHLDVLAVTGQDVAAFADRLIQDEPTFFDE
ncbi:MAG: DUF1048 domain-containing protein [Enterococcus sp.]